MPKEINGQKMTGHEEEIWEKAFKAAQGKSHSAGAVATAAVQKYRQGKKGQQK